MGLKRTGYAENNIQLISLAVKKNNDWSSWKNNKSKDTGEDTAKDSKKTIKFGTSTKAIADLKKKKAKSSRSKCFYGSASALKAHADSNMYYKTRSQTWYTDYKKLKKPIKDKNGKITGYKTTGYSLKRHIISNGQYKYIKTGKMLNLIDDDMQPSEMKVTFSDIDVKDGNAGTDVGRNTKGYITRNRVRGSLRSIEVTWNYLTQKQISTLMGVARSEFVWVTYTDPTGVTKTIATYPSDTTFEASNLGHWTNISMTFVEV